MITPEEFKARMEELLEKNQDERFGYDEENFHIDADDLLVETLTELGYGDGCKIFEEAPKWYC